MRNYLAAAAAIMFFRPIHAHPKLSPCRRAAPRVLVQGRSLDQWRPKARTLFSTVSRRPARLRLPNADSANYRHRREK